LIELKDYSKSLKIILSISDEKVVLYTFDDSTKENTLKEVLREKVDTSKNDPLLVTHPH
jgi:hypothetical protein